MSTILEKATAFTASYAAAMALSLSTPPTSASSVATALGNHYNPTFTSFTFGTVSTMGPHPQTGILAHLHNFEASGLGYRIHKVGERIEVVNDSPGGSALCWITWTIEPKDEGTEGWEWTNVYGFRDGEKREGLEVEGSWEFTVADREIAGILQRRPEFFSMGGKS